MPRSLALLLSAGALALGVAACGGSSSNSSSAAASAGNSAATSSTAAAATSTTSTAAPSSGSSGSAASSHLAISANSGGALMFSTTHLTAKAGTVSITFTNHAPEGHNFTLMSPGGKTIGATPTFDGGAKTLTVKLQPGKYMFMCTVPGHAQGGMTGTLTVT